MMLSALRWMRSWVAALLLAATVGPALAGEAPAPTQASQEGVAADPAVEALIVEARGFYDGLADDSKRKLYKRIALGYDPAGTGTLQRPIDPPRRFGTLRLYPRGYDLARRVAGLPQAHQQRLWDYVVAHQLRSGWIAKAPGP